MAEAWQDRVVVIGAGLTGLTAAYRFGRRGAVASASKRPLEVQLYEARDRPGGAIWTERREGFTLEGGADSFITDKPWAVELCRELGLGPEFMPTDPAHRRSFVVRQGRLLPIPDGFILMAPGRLLPLLTTPILSWKGKLRLLMEPLIPARRDAAEESVAAFVRRRLGREALERLVQPLVGGVYTGDPAELSLRATFPRFQEMEARHGSLFRAMRRASGRGTKDDEGGTGARYGLFVTLREGMGTLPAALAGQLAPGVLRTETPVRRLVPPEGHRAGPWRVELLDGSVVEAAAVLVATEAHAAARLIDGFDPELAQTLRSIPYASSAIVQLAYRRDQVGHPLDGFGAVVPSAEGRPILAVSFTSVKFPNRAPAGTVLLRVFIGGATQPELLEEDDRALSVLATQEVASLLGARGEPILTEVVRHHRAMPQLTLGHLDRLERIRARLATRPGLVLAGNYFDGVGVPDCVRSGQMAADEVMLQLINRDSSAAA